MANQDSGAGQHDDEDMTSDQWAQQASQQIDDQPMEGMMLSEQPQQADMGGQTPDIPRGGGMGRQPQQPDDVSDQDQWEQQQRGLSGQPFSPLDEEPMDEEEEWQEEEEQDISEIDQM